MTTKALNQKQAYLLKPGSAGAVVERFPLDPHALSNFTELARLIGARHAEHVVALLDGKRIHMFVDDEGHLRDETKNDINPRATALYHNATLARADVTQNTSRVLTDDGDQFDLYFAPGVPVIVGTVLVWPHGCPGWEPDGEPWEEYL
jgi:hypothetical protein